MIPDRVLNRYFKLRSRWKKNRARGFQPKATKSRDFIQADTVDLGELFLYTAIDIFTREVAVVLGENLEAKEGARCIKEILKNLVLTKYSKQIMVDNLAKIVVR